MPSCGSGKKSPPSSSVCAASAVGFTTPLSRSVTRTHVVEGTVDDAECFSHLVLTHSSGCFPDERLRLRLNHRRAAQPVSRSAVIPGQDTLTSKLRFKQSWIWDFSCFCFPNSFGFGAYPFQNTFQGPGENGVGKVWALTELLARSRRHNFIT